MRATSQCHRACAVRCVIAVWLLVTPVPGLACEIADVPWPTLLESATEVFIGRVATSQFVRDADGTVRSNPDRRLGQVAVFDVQTRFKGPAADEVVVSPSCGDCLDTCSFTFVEGYQMVVPPGDYDISVTRDGGTVGATVRVAASDRDVLRLTFHSDGGYCLHRTGSATCE